MSDTNLPSTAAPQATYQPGQALPTVGSPEYAASQKMAPTPSAAPAPATPAANPNPTDSSGMNSDSFTGLLGSIGQKLKYNNELATSRQLLLKHLYDSPLTPDEISKLPKDIQDVVSTGNKDAMELQVRVLNDQLQGRANTLGQTVQALTTGYTQSVTNTKNAVAQILAYAQSTGKPIADVAKALGPVFGTSISSDMMKSLESLGVAVKPLAGTPVGSSDAIFGPATSTVSSALGVAPTTPLATVLDQNGMDPIVDAIIANEGSSPEGVVNNPGNIKYDPNNPQTGQTDSGVKASDGGTFASYDTPQNGRAAIEYIVHNAADNTSAAYGANPTLGSFMDMYTNTAPDRSVSPLPPDKSAGDVPSVGGYTPNAIYQDALELMMTGKSVQSFVGGLSNSGDSKTIKTAITNKAASIAASLGGSFPSFQALYKANASAAKQNVERVARVESIATAMTLNVPRLQQLATRLQNANPPVTITESDIQAGKAAALRKFGSEDAAAYIELIQTIRSDYGATQAALAGSRGGQFFSQAANDAIPVGLSADQYGTVKDTIVLSSTNAKKAIDDEVQSLIGVSGSVDPNQNSNNDSYADYMKNIGK